MYREVDFMGQQEVLEWLIRQRLSGEIKFFSVNEIIEGLGRNCPRPSSVRATINKLVDYGYIQSAHNIEWQKRYRVKSKYANKIMLNVLTAPVIHTHEVTY